MSGLSLKQNLGQVMSMFEVFVPGFHLISALC